MLYGKYLNDNDKIGGIQDIGKKFTGVKYATWSRSLHDGKGILLKGDGNIFFINAPQLGNELISSKNEKNRFHFPRGK